MRRGPEVSGWCGSLFPEPIDQVKAPSDRCVCHQDCPQYETCETEALDKSSKVYYLLRCVRGKFPACTNCMCMACDRYQECKDGPEMGLRGGVRYRLCNRPISITGCLDYSGSVPWISEAACKKCDHVCDLRKELIWAPRVRCDLNPVEPTKKPTEEPSPVQLDGKPTVEHPTLIRYGHETWGRYELEGRLVEEFVSTDKPVRKESEFAADMIAVDAARKAAGDLPLARSFIEKGARGIRVYDDPALQEGGTLCCHLVVSKQNGGLCTGCSDQRGTPCSYSRPAEHTSPEPVIKPWKPEGAVKKWQELHCGKHHACRDDCAGLRSGALCPFVISLSFLKDIVREGSLPADLLDDRAKDDAETKAAKKPAKPAFHKGERVKFRDDLAPGGVGFGYITGIERHGGVGGLSVHVTWAEYGKEEAMVKNRSYQLMSPDQLELAPEDESPKPAKAKKSSAASRANRNRDLEALAPHGCLGASTCLCHSCVNQETCGQCKRMNKSVCGHYHAHTMECPAYSKAEGEGWTCSDCLCPQCANKGESCHTCEGPIYCSKHGGKIGACPDFRTEEGKEQHCLENGCLCFKCQLIGDQCEECPGPVRCDGPRMKCKDYVGAEVEA